MTGRTHVVLALRIARELHEAGDSVRFIVHSSVVPLFKDTPFTYVPVEDHLGPLVELLIDAHVRDASTSSVILADYFTVNMFLPDMGVDPEFLTRYDVPVIAIDIWNYAQTGYAIDTYFDKSKRIPTWIERLTHRLIPVPIVCPVVQPGIYGGLPEPIAVPRRVRSHVRGNVGVGEHDRVVLFCTASWQHPPLSDEHGERISQQVPMMVGEYMGQLGDSVHLVHVGPTAYPLKDVLGERYHWLPSLTANQFALLVGSADLLLSLNISATTNAKAIASSLPVVVLENSVRARTLEEAAESVPMPRSPTVIAHLRESLPLYPFSLWPLGFYDFLRPLLSDNSYCDAVRIVELLDEERVVGTCHDLLFSEGARQDLAQRQLDYVRQVERLPTALETINAILAEEPCGRS